MPETPEEGLVWAKHCAEEIGNWAAFLPQLYGLYRVVDRPERNPFADLTVDRDGGRPLPDLGVTTYRAEVVGSLLRPPELVEARAASGGDARP